MQIVHIMRGGTRVADISGVVVPAREFPELYRIMKSAEVKRYA